MNELYKNIVAEYSLFCSIYTFFSEAEVFTICIWYCSHIVASLEVLHIS